MDNLHSVQMRILRDLTFKPRSRFSDMKAEDLTNDHFSYHIRTLVEMGYIEKIEQTYSLTTKGKAYTTHMDTEKSQIENLPKVSVLVIAKKRMKGIFHYAISTRTKEPYFGYVGFITGKVRFGEMIHEAALRELEEEMGLTGKINHCFILHEMVYDEEGNQLEDKFFHVVEAVDTKGELLKQTQDGKNKWVLEKDFIKLEPKFHNEMEIFDWYKNKERGFKEKKYIIKKF